jgi:hypothetical protein
VSLLQAAAPFLCGVGGAVFVVALAVGGNVVYGVALLTFAAGLAGFAARPTAGHGRAVVLVYGGLAVATAAAVVDGSLDLADATGVVTSACTVVIIAGVGVALLGRLAGRPSP